ncbi:hypothetical protein LINPERHAP2_LOCUS39326, partial [Linum perenne]
VVRKGGKKVAASRQQNISVTEKGVSIVDSPTKRSKKAVNIVATTKKRGRTENENVVGGSKKQRPDIVLPSAELFDSALASRTEAILLRDNLARACDQCLHLIPEYKSSIAALDAFIDSSAEHDVSGVGGKTSDEVADNAIDDVSADVTTDQASAPVLDASAPVLDATDVVLATNAAINDATDDDVVAQVNERTDDGEGTTKNDDEDEDSVDSDEDDADDKGGEKDDSNDDNADDKGGKKDDTNDDDTDDKGGDIPVGDDAIPEGNQETNVPFQTDASIPDESGKEPTNSAVGPHRSSFVDYSVLSKDDQEALDDIVSVIIFDDDGKKANYSGDDLHCSPKSPPHVGIVPPKVSSPLETLVHAIQMKEAGDSTSELKHMVIPDTYSLGKKGSSSNTMVSKQVTSPIPIAPFGSASKISTSLQKQSAPIAAVPVKILKSATITEVPVLRSETAVTDYQQGGLNYVVAYCINSSLDP